MVNFVGYSERVRAQGVSLIGELAWYSVSDTASVEYDTLKGLVEQHDAPFKLPKRPRNADVFKRACTAAELKKCRTSSKHLSVNYNIRQTSPDDDFINRAVVGEMVDAENKVLGYETLADISFRKEDEFIEVSPKKPQAELDSTYPDYTEVVDAVYHYVASMGSILSTAQLRIAMQATFTGPLQGVAVRDGGTVYFVENVHTAGLEAVAQVCRELAGVSVGIAPCIDDEIQRHSISKAYEMEALKQSDHLYGKLMELKEFQELNGFVPANKFSSLQGEFVKYNERFTNLNASLGCELNKVELTLAQAQSLFDSIIAGEMSNEQKS